MNWSANLWNSFWHPQEFSPFIQKSASIFEWNPPWKYLGWSAGTYNYIKTDNSKNAQSIRFIFCSSGCWITVARCEEGVLFRRPAASTASFRLFFCTEEIGILEGTGLSFVTTRVYYLTAWKSPRCRSFNVQISKRNSKTEFLASSTGKESSRIRSQLYYDYS